MRNGETQSGNAGIILAVITGILQPVLLAFLPTAVMQSIWLPVLALRYGSICAFLCEMAAIGCAGTLWGAEAAVIMALLTAIPGGLGIWLSRRDTGLPLKIQWLFVAQVICCMLALVFWRLICGMDVADHLAEKMAKLITGDAGGLVLYGGSLMGWFSADTMIRISEYGGTAAEIAGRLTEDLRMLLPAHLFSSSALTALAAAWWPTHVLARQGMAEKGQYVPLDRWWIPTKYILYLAVGTMLFITLYGFGMDTAGVLAQTSLALSVLALKIQGAAGLCASMKKRDIGRRMRAIYLALLVLVASGVLEMIGIWICLAGSRGAIRMLLEKIHKDDEDDERGD